MRTRWIALAIVVTIFFLPQTADAHIPIGDAGETLDTATWVDDPTKSWVAYTELHVAGEAQYFRFNITAGTLIDLRLGIPIESVETSFRPVLVLMGPGLTNQSTPPAFMEIPAGAGVMVFDNEPEFNEFEGFTPSSFHLVADIEIPAPETGTYYVAVYEESNAGRYSMVFGWIEAYTPWDWISIPLNTIMVHHWDGQHLVIIFAPYAVACLLGLLYIYRKQEIRNNGSWKTWFAAGGAILIGGTSLSVLFQTVIALLATPVNLLIIVTLFVILVSIVSFLGTVRVLKAPEWHSVPRNGSILIALGALSLFLWSGYLIGPALLLIAGLGGLSSYTSQDEPDVHDIIP